MQDKRPYNKQGQPHGLWEIYYENGNLDWKGLYVNGYLQGKFECYNNLGMLTYLDYNINGETHGYKKYLMNYCITIEEYHAK